jgi:protein subunit release factor A
MKYTVFIHQAEGGQDSRLFCNDLYAAYMRLASAMRWPVS